MACRGLVFNDDGEVVARPFRKFFNDDEPNPERIPWNEPFQIYDKLDGSLILLFYYGRQWWTASRGSFDSEQAFVAGDIIKCKYASVLPELHVDLTYLFEVIYPQNQIVVNYGATKDLFLLGVVRRDGTGEISLSNTERIPKAFKQVHTYPASLADGIEALRGRIEDSKEGFVVRFNNGLRLKVKGETYRSLHRIITDLNSKRIWEYLSEGGSASTLTDLLTTKAHAATAGWARSWIEHYTTKFDANKQLVQRTIHRCSQFSERKLMATHIHEQCGPEHVQGAAFAGLDGKEYDHLIWKAMKPELAEKPPKGIWLKPE